jgi:hypothetical protein
LVALAGRLQEIGIFEITQLQDAVDHLFFRAARCKRRFSHAGGFDRTQRSFPAVGMDLNALLNCL